MFPCLLLPAFSLLLSQVVSADPYGPTPPPTTSSTSSSSSENTLFQSDALESSSILLNTILDAFLLLEPPESGLKTSCKKGHAEDEHLLSKRIVKRQAVGGVVPFPSVGPDGSLVPFGSSVPGGNAGILGISGPGGNSVQFGGAGPDGNALQTGEGAAQASGNALQAGGNALQAGGNMGQAGGNAGQLGPAGPPGSSAPGGSASQTGGQAAQSAELSGGCGNEMLSQIMHHVLDPLLARNDMRVGDIAQILQTAVQQATGKSFEIMMGRGNMKIASYQADPAASCRVEVGGYSTTAYETPVQYNINNGAEERFMSNIDFGQRMGGSGYPGQQPFPQLNPIDQSLINLHSSFNRRECFSGDMLVETTEGPKRMRDLKTGDEVMSMDESLITFSPIFMFLHRDEQFLAEFNVITTSSGDSVKLTNEHLIYVSDCGSDSELRLIRAREVTPEHCVVSHTLNDSRVTNVTKTYETGIYAPLTATGHIIVNNVLCSCHSNLAASTLQQSLFSVYRSLSSLLPKEGELPLGLEYLANTLDLFIPVKSMSMLS